MEMSRLSPNSPAFDEARHLLAAADLPTDDLEECDLFLWGLFLDGELCGVVGLEALGKVGLLRSLLVPPDCRGRALGDRLLGRVRKEGRALGLTQLYLLTMDAAGFFETRGFVDVDRKDAPVSVRNTRQFSTLCPGSARLMASPISLLA